MVLLVNDLPRAETFYAPVLGCVVGYSCPALGMDQVWGGSALIVLWDVTQPGAASAIAAVPGGCKVVQVCIAPAGSTPRRCAHLAAHGVKVDREAPHGGARSIGHSFDIHDPFGNKLEVKGPAEYPDGRAGARPEK